MREAMLPNAGTDALPGSRAEVEEAQRVSEHVLAATARRYKEELALGKS